MSKDLACRVDWTDVGLTLVCFFGWLEILGVLVALVVRVDLVARVDLVGFVAFVD